MKKVKCNLATTYYFKLKETEKKLRQERRKRKKAESELDKLKRKLDEMEGQIKEQEEELEKEKPQAILLEPINNEEEIHVIDINTIIR